MSNVSERVSQLLGFDPTKNNPERSVVVEALKEVQEERGKKLKEQVKEKLAKLIDSWKQAVQKKKEADAIYAKQEKEVGKLLNQLEAMANGKEPPVENGEKKEEEVADQDVA